MPTNLDNNLNISTLDEDVLTPSLFSQVIVDISSSEVDKIFDYACDESIKIGSRVIVPFGPREIEGFVIGIKHSTDWDIKKIKPIKKVLDDMPVISLELLSLKDYMVDSLGLKVVDILRLFIPSQMRGGRIKELNAVSISLNPEYTIDDESKLIKKSSQNQRDVFRHICEVQSEFLRTLNKEFSTTAINALVTKGIFIKSVQKLGRVPYKGMGEYPSKTIKLTPLQSSAVDSILNIYKQVLSHNDIPDIAEISLSDNSENSGDSTSSKNSNTITSKSTDINTSNSNKVLDKYDEVSDNKFLNYKKNTILLHGVTGSGKTEVYMHLIDSVLKQEKTAIVLVPEISLTPQTLRIFRGRFGDRVAILHSGLSAGERFDEWQRLLTGQAKVAVGARSAIFAPLKDIGIIIIDEEHDTSYQSESNPRYNTKDIAKYRANLNNCILVLGSATPSIESYYKTTIGEYSLVEMPQRVNFKPLPHIQIVDMKKEIYRGNDSPFSRDLLHGLENCLTRQGDKAMLFLNRRGYSSYVICRECGLVAKCTDCDVSLVYHKQDNVLKCHFCQNRYASLTHCPSCKSEHIRRGYVGTEQIVEKLKEIFPNVGILRMDNDTTQNKDSHLNILNEFKDGKARILVGTQMIAKGHDFSDVTFVGIIDADMSLHFADYRACERTYQLVTQVSGRAGRVDKEGSVVLQTYTPNHYAYRYAINGDYKGFFSKECNLREVTKYPPFSTIIRVLVSSEHQELAQTTLKTIFEEIVSFRTTLDKDIDSTRSPFIYLACMRSPVNRIQNKHRMQVLMRIIPSKTNIITKKIFEITRPHQNTQCNVFVEINPGNLS